MKKLDKDFMNFVDSMLDTLANDSDDLNLITFNNVNKLNNLLRKISRYVGDNLLRKINRYVDDNISNENDEHLKILHDLNNVIIQVNNILNDFIKENNIILSD